MARATIHMESPKKPKNFLRLLALFFSLVAILFIVLAILTFQTANEITRIDAEPLAGFSANVMPDYRNVSFRSLDESITLTGWFFPSTGQVKGTVVMVHSAGSNRLPFGADSARLYEQIIDQGFQIMAFDLRASGESDGEIQTFGYVEWEDVVAAMQYSVQLSGQTDFVLFGIGTGITAAIRAYDRLPQTEADKEDLENGSLIEQRLAELSFEQNAVKGFIFDTALANGDDYISYVVGNSDRRFSSILRETVPLAVRMSSGLSDNLFIAGAVSRMNQPMLLINQERIDGIDPADIEPSVRERERIFPNRTWTYQSASRTFLGAYNLDAQSYRAAVQDYLIANFY